MTRKGFESLHQSRGESRTPSAQVIIAALDEEEGIGPTIGELNSTLGRPHVLVVDGRSKDRTVEIAESMGAEILLQDGHGKGNALAKAVRHVDDVDYVVLTDADYTYPADYINQMIRILEKNHCVGMVCGNRFGKRVDKEAMGSAFYFGNRLLSITHNALNGVRLEDPLTGLRVVRANILRDWEVKSKGFDVEVELNHHVERKGFDIVEIPISYRPRLGEKKLKVKHGISIIKRMMLEVTL